MILPADRDASIAVVGIPFDGNSSFLMGAAGGPAAIRNALKNDSTNMSTESVIDLGSNRQWIDVGDIVVDNYRDDIESGIHDLIKVNLQPISLGGDHSISYPILKALNKAFGNITILHLDAHGDLYHDFEGNKYSHASPFARIMEEGLASRLVQVGIRTMTPHQLEQARKFDVEVIEMKDFSPELNLKFDYPLYLSLDMDVLDPAFAPGVSHYEPGGLTTRDVLSIIQNIECPLVGADIVELNPERDINGTTGMVAAKFLKEIIDHMINYKV